jgi:hypothetical protein
MPIVGRNRKATPLAVWEVFRDTYAGSFIKAFPKPRPHESFNEYFQRIDWKEEAIFAAIIGVGCTTDGSPVNQRDFLQSLEDMSEVVQKLRFGLNERWER